MQVEFFTEGISFSLPGKKQIISWVQRVIKMEGGELNHLNFIFCSDEHLLAINKTYLNHDFYTDILTFDQSDKNEVIEGDIFISIERVRENAEENNVSFENELNRVMIHGVLHLLGYNDSSENEKNIMRKKEEACLSLYKRST